MNKRTLAGLIICYFIINTCGNGLMPLMPLFVQEYGASGGFAGIYTALAYLCLAAGTMLGGKISDYVNKRKLLLFIKPHFRNVMSSFTCVCCNDPAVQNDGISIFLGGY